MNKIKKLGLVAMSLYSCLLFAENEAIYDPATKILKVPLATIKGDNLQTPFAIDLRYLGGDSCEVVSFGSNAHECNQYMPTSKSGSFTNS